MHLGKSRSHMQERRSRMDRRGLKSKAVSTLAAVYHLCGSAAVHVGLIEYDVGSHVCWPGGEHLLLAVDQIAGVEGGQLKSVAVSDCIRGAGFNAVPAENAAVVIDVVNLGIALGAADTLLGGIFRGLDIDAIRGTISGAQEAGHALFQSVLV